MPRLGIFRPIGRQRPRTQSEESTETSGASAGGRFERIRPRRSSMMIAGAGLIMTLLFCSLIGPALGRRAATIALGRAVTMSPGPGQLHAQPGGPEGQWSSQPLVDGETTPGMGLGDAGMEEGHGAQSSFSSGQGGGLGAGLGAGHQAGGQESEGQSRGSSPPDEAPEVPAYRAESSLRPIKQAYYRDGRRDPFDPLLGDQAGVGELLNPDGANIVGVMWGDSGRLGLFEDRNKRCFTLSQGDRVLNGRLTSLGRRHATFTLTTYGIVRHVKLELKNDEN